MEPFNTYILMLKYQDNIPQQGISFGIVCGRVVVKIQLREQWK